MQQRAEVEFKVGDKAVYPALGVTEVISIEDNTIGGSSQRFYILRVVATERKIMVPVSNAGTVGLRQMISEQEIIDILNIVRERALSLDTQTWNRRYRGFMEKIMTGSIYDAAEVWRDLSQLNANRQLSFGERRMLDKARSLVLNEIAISRGQTEEQVRNEIDGSSSAN